MSKLPPKIDPAQAAFDFSARVESYIQAKSGLLDAVETSDPRPAIESSAEVCIEIAGACKRAIRRSGLSREQLLDKIQDLYGTKLSPHMLNHWLSKPAQYPMPAHILLAIALITEDLAPLAALAEPIGARVITKSEIRQLTLGQLDQTITEMQRLKRRLKGD